MIQFSVSRSRKYILYYIIVYPVETNRIRKAPSVRIIAYAKGFVFFRGRFRRILRSPQPIDENNSLFSAKQTRRRLTIRFRCVCLCLFIQAIISVLLQTDDKILLPWQYRIVFTRLPGTIYILNV